MVSCSYSVCNEGSECGNCEPDDSDYGGGGDGGDGGGGGGVEDSVTPEVPGALGP